MNLADLFPKEKDKALIAKLVAESGMSEENIVRAAIRLYQSATVRATQGQHLVFVDPNGNVIVEQCGCMGDDA